MSSTIILSGPVGLPVGAVDEQWEPEQCESGDTCKVYLYRLHA